MNKTIRSYLLPLLATWLVLPIAPAWATVLIGPTPYLSFSDSPASGRSFSYFQLETFESGVLGATGVTASGGSVLGPGQFTDSVDADDGLIDGSGLGGHSWYAAGNRSLSFTFDASTLGALPTFAGIVWTDVGFTDGGVFGPAPVIFEAFDSLNNSLGAIGPFALGDGSVNGTTAEDRFFGVIDATGISRITISMPTSGDWEVDHLQFGLLTTSVPEPSTLLLGVLGVAGLWSTRRRPLRK
jgi:PEP-CTERM motif